MMKYESFGLYPPSVPKQTININWRSELPVLNNISGSVLPYGMGKSYGDSCLNSDNTLLITRGMNNIVNFDRDTGLIKAEAGILLSELIEFLLPLGWFLPVTPGTKHITLGGAVANDVHGKNHYKVGSFGCYVLSFELYRSDGNIYNCSATENAELFNATIGGLGLTGLITTIEFQAVKIPSAYIENESIKFNNLKEFYEINEDSLNYEFTVAWLLCSPNTWYGQGIYQRGNYSEKEKGNFAIGAEGQIPYPLKFPMINFLTVGAFNSLYYNKQQSSRLSETIHYDPFFYPLDKAANWNYAYGNSGFVQYQFVLPEDIAYPALIELFELFSKKGLYSFLTVLKSFGNRKSPGLLSFPKEGITLAVDFRMEGRKTLDALNYADEIVLNRGGRLYPAKDARMSPLAFKISYPEIEEFKKYIDPKFSSDFWRRVNL